MLGIGVSFCRSFFYSLANDKGDVLRSKSTVSQGCITMGRAALSVLPVISYVQLFREALKYQIFNAKKDRTFLEEHPK